jgi:hypothetical protein
LPAVIDCDETVNNFDRVFRTTASTFLFYFSSSFSSSSSSIGGVGGNHATPIALQPTMPFLFLTPI